jgi:two-component system, chemotaxis family, CheB/CheR fusion protein
MEESRTPQQIVIIGSSAGGIEALSILVSALPANFPTPIVIAQHLDPQHSSHLEEILANKGTLPVHTIFDQIELLPSHIYIAPPDRHLEISDSQVFLREDGMGRPKPSIDLLLATAAQAYGDGLVAVILTGIGSDGATGALEVKKRGGIVIIQDPSTAPYPAMPRSLAPTSVDFIAHIEEIGSLLYDLVMGIKVFSQATESKMLLSFLQHLHERSGLDFTSYKMPTIQRRLHRRMVAAGITSIPSYSRYLQNHPEEYSRLISSFLIKVTEFFRDQDLYAVLREQILPELISTAAYQGNELRFWSAGCATGEEAYSLAILLADVLRDDLDQYTIRIFATDLDNDAINFARRGIYPASSVAGLSPDIIARFFHKIDGEYEIQKRVRSMVIFGQHDLGQRAPFPRIDLILCRNVLIYFTLELQKRVLQLFAYSLRDRGYLVLGRAETTSPLAEFFSPIHPALKIYQRQGERLLIPVGHIKDATPLRPASVRTPSSGVHLLPTRETTRIRTSMEKLGSLVFNLPLGVIVVDRHYDIQIINGYAHQFLGIHRSAIGEDLLHLVEGIPSKTLRTIIDAALRGEGLPPRENTLSLENEVGEQRYLRIIGYPHQFDGEDGSVANVLLLVTDVTDEIRRQQITQQQGLEQRTRIEGDTESIEEELRQKQEEIARLTDQVQHLIDTNRELREANQELTATNVELHQSNEEYLVNTEEVQAAAEEVETLNEELQATNEELETLNEELQATVEELNTTNDDLEARSDELQQIVQEREEQRRASEAERTQLSAILVSMGDAVLVVDTAGKPILTNTSFSTLFGDNPKLDDESGQSIPPSETIQQRAARSETFNMTLTLVAPDGSRRWFEANGQPIQSDGILQGGVVVIRDITDRSIRRLQEEFLALASHELRTPLTSAQAALQLLIKKLHDNSMPGSYQHQANIALRQIHRMNVLVDDLIDVGRLQTGTLHLDMHPVNLVDLVKQCVDSIQLTVPERDLHLTVYQDTLMVQGDALRLEQILLNLLTNAIKYASESQRIDIRIRQAEDKVELQVQDYGPGIAEEKLASIFNRFYQAAPGQTQSREGLGLGLFIVRELVQAHGGTIRVNTQLGMGTTMTILLPLLLNSAKG